MNFIVKLFRKTASRSEISRELINLSLMLFLFSFLGTNISPAYAQERPGDKGEFHVVRGYVEDISYDNIKVKGQYYDIKNVRVKDKAGIDARSRLTKGSLVDIHFMHDRLAEVIFIHGYLHQ